MTDVVVQDKDVIIEVAQPTVPAGAPPLKIGLVEINQIVARGTAWLTGNGPPTGAGGQYGDMYLDATTGDMYQWDGHAWQYVGTFAPATDTPAEVLAKLITVDGAGSALDADLLDGQHGAFYAKASDLTANTARDDLQDSQITSNTTAANNNTAAIATINTDQTTQNNRLTAIETKNTTQDSAIALLAPIANPVFTGDPKAPTASPGDNDTSIATTAFVTGAINTANAGGPWAPLASPTFSGDPKAPTPATNDNDTSIANTAWVTSKLAALPPSGIPEAPNDGVQYVRQSLNWAPVIVPPGTYVADSPPASPSPNQLWWKSNLGQLFIYYLDPGGAPAQWVQAAGSATGQVRNTARTRNRVNNPTAQVSQEWGTTPVTTGSYAADQWYLSYAGVSAQAQKITLSTPTPEGTTSAMAIWATTAKGSLAAGDYLVEMLPIEGLDLADLGWGTSSAKPAVLRFCAVGDTAGTYGISIRNSASNRSWLGSFTVTTAGVPQVFSVAIPGDVTGTWLKDTGIGLTLIFTYAAGTTFVGTAGWNAGNFFVPPGCSNGAAIANSVLRITDVGLYADPDGTGLPPPFVAPPYEDDLQRCKRYWQQFFLAFSGTVTSGQTYHAPGNAPVQPRAGPSFTGVNYGNGSFPATVGTLNTVNAMSMYEQRVANATGPVSYYMTIVTANARLI